MGRRRTHHHYRIVTLTADRLLADRMETAAGRREPGVGGMRVYPGSGDDRSGIGLDPDTGRSRGKDVVAF